MLRDHLTKRQLETAKNLAIGRTPIEIATAMGLSEQGVRSHIKEVKRHFGKSSVTALLGSCSEYWRLSCLYGKIVKWKDKGLTVEEWVDYKKWDQIYGK